jgi:hypothetical protein
MQETNARVLSRWVTVNQSEYKGSLVEGVPSGLGTMIYRRDATGKPVSYYVGDFLDGEPHGQGLRVNVDWSYEGQFKRGCRTGKGVKVYANGDSLCGTFINGAAEGYGFFRWADGGWYEGNYSASIARHGTGTMFWLVPEPVLCVGDWNRNDRTGMHRMHVLWSRGVMYANYEKEGRRGGALFQWNSGDWWSGTCFDHDTGWGVKHLVNGGMLIGLWGLPFLRHGIGTMMFVPPGRTTEEAVWGTVTNNTFFCFMIKEDNNNTLPNS